MARIVGEGWRGVVLASVHHMAGVPGGEMGEFCSASLSGPVGCGTQLLHAILFSFKHRKINTFHLKENDPHYMSSSKQGKQ